MDENFITYRTGYKYQLDKNYSIQTEIFPDAPIDDGQFIQLGLDGVLHIRRGYAWDGTSGPVIDTPENMRASLVHDALYQLMRNEWLDHRQHKESADQLFKAICIEDGIDEKIAKIYYLALQVAGHPAADPKNRKHVHIAPAA